MNDKLNYVGNELDVFSHANNWKSYFSSIIRPYLNSSVLEVGAGIGSTTKLMCMKVHKTWVCLEPDVELAGQIAAKIKNNELPSFCRVKSSLLSNLPKDIKYSSIIYIDVLEHIEDNITEVKNAIELLEDKGYLIVLSPAHNYLYTDFDKSIGHFRRYSKETLKLIIPNNMKIEKLYYLDSFGYVLSLLNKVLNISNPKKKTD